MSKFLSKKGKESIRLRLALIGGSVLAFMGCGAESLPDVDHSNFPGTAVFGQAKNIGVNSIFDQTGTLSKKLETMVRKELAINESSTLRLHFKADVNMRNADQIDSAELSFSLNSIPHCGISSRVSLLADDSMLILGRKPINSDPDLSEASFFGDPEAVKSLFAERLLVQSIDFENFGESNLQAGPTVLTESPDDQLQVHSMNRCYYHSKEMQKDHLESAYELYVTFNGFPYFGIASENEVFLLEKRFFNVTGKATIYKTNPIANDLEEVSFEGFTGTGYMDTDLFTTSVESLEPRLKKEDHNFSVGLNEVGFAESHMFFNALRQYEYYKGLGFEWYGPAPLIIKVHPSSSLQRNNGLYKPGGQPGVPQPEIIVGDGDGVLLQNLTFDADVIGHEANHHLVFKRLKSTSGESLILHEGLADYFVFSRTNNACLGESICPDSDQSICYVPKKCLRTAENDLVYLDAQYNAFGGAAHLKSQLLSGVLWDIRQDSATVAEDFDKVVFRAVDLLATTSGFRDLIVALYKVDQENGSPMFDVLQTKIAARGLQQFVEGISKGGPLPAIEGKQETSTLFPAEAETTSKTSNSKSGGGGGCSVSVAGGNPLTSLLIILSFAPLLGRFRRSLKSF